MHIYIAGIILARSAQHGQSQEHTHPGPIDRGFARARTHAHARTHAVRACCLIVSHRF